MRNTVTLTFFLFVVLAAFLSFGPFVRTADAATSYPDWAAAVVPVYPHV
jgi:hypothetical protein